MILLPSIATATRLRCFSVVEEVGEGVAGAGEFVEGTQDFVLNIACKPASATGAVYHFVSNLLG